jgi:arylsulfatase A-like enzyme
MVKRRAFLKAMSLGAVNAVVPAFPQTLSAAKSPPTSKPNVLIIMSDQHRAGLSKRSGYPLDTTPTLDRLAAQGVAFDQAYATAPLCVPSRVSLLTGRWPHAHRARQNSGIEHAFFESDIFDVVKALDYRTGLVGKNHTYLTPEKLDFWRLYSHLWGWKAADAPKEIVAYDHWLELLNHGVSQQPTPFPLEAQLPYRIVSNAIEFMQSAEDRPFALWVSFPEPHNPYQVPKPYFDMFPPDQVPDRAVGPEALKNKGFKWHWLRGLQEYTYPGYDNYWRRTKSDYLGMLRLIDDQLARLFSYMEKTDVLKNTIIVYLADHGDYLTDYGLMRKGVGMPEALIRIPMVWSGWGIQGSQPRHPVHVSIADVMPTICEALGAEIPRGAQGRSLWPLLQGKDFPQEEFRSVYAEVGFGGLHYDSSDNVPYSIAELPGVPGAQKSFDELNPVTQSGYLKMVRMGKWKLFYDMMGSGELYDLSSDPCELNNLFGDPSVATEQRQLLQELLAWTVRTQDSLPTAAYKTKWPIENHNWYATYRHGT